MYDKGTILKLREPRSTDDTLFAYDRIEVIGTSPLSHGSAGSSWVGSARTAGGRGRTTASGVAAKSSRMRS